MTSIRFVVMQDSDIRNVRNLANNLTLRQTEYQFFVHDTVLKFPKCLNTASDPLEQFEKLAMDLCADQYPDEYPVVICNYKFKDYSFAKISDDVTTISTGALPATSSRDFLQKYIAFVLVDALMSLQVQVGAHHVPRGCVGDSWSRARDVSAGIRQGQYCSECRPIILSSIGTAISLHDLAAIFRMLDYVADRKTCFVIMPFNKKFDAVYVKCLQPALIEKTWVPRRADKIFQSREIMALVWEEILRADLVIADLTGKNANVFYELGYAHALDKQTILITQSIKDVPFDLRHRQLIEYVSTPTGLKKLAAAVAQYL